MAKSHPTLNLPPPLSAEEEKICWEENDIQKIVEHNLRLVHHIAKKFSNTNHDKEDLFSEGSMGLLKAAYTFDQKRGVKFATYAARCIQNEILMFLRKSRGQKLEISLDEALTVDQDGNELSLRDVIPSDEPYPEEAIWESYSKDILELAVLYLPPRQAVVIQMRYLSEDEITQEELGARLGISQSYVSRIKRKALKNVRIIMRKLDPEINP